jgi:hypothetical protein
VVNYASPRDRGRPGSDEPAPYRTASAA